MEKRNLPPAAKYGYLAVSVVIVIVGLILIFSPESAAGLVCTIFGILMLVWGAEKIIVWFLSAGFVLDIFLGIIMAVIGGVSLFHPEGFIRLIFGAAGFGILIDGIFKIKKALDLKKAGYRWKFYMVTSCITAAAGFILLANPFSAVKFVISLSGVGVLIAGISNLVSSIHTIKTPPTEVFIDSTSDDVK